MHEITKTLWNALTLYWLDSALELDDAERIGALAEYRRTGGMTLVVFLQPDSENVTAEEAERLSEAGPKVDEIDWTGMMTHEESVAWVRSVKQSDIGKDLDAACRGLGYHPESLASGGVDRRWSTLCDAVEMLDMIARNRAEGPPS